MKAFALVALLLQGCSLAIADDAMSACERINAAVHSFEQRCGVPYEGELQDCSTVLFSSGTSTAAEECEQQMAARDCEDRSLIPEPCRLSYVSGF